MGSQIVKPRRIMYGTSFAENVVAFYLSRVTEVRQQVKIARWFYDIYLPQLSVVIEYDGAYFHKERKSLDKRKEVILANRGIRLIRVIEDRVDNHVNGDIIYVKDGHIAVSRFQFVLDSICDILDLTRVHVCWVSDYDVILERSVKSQKKSSLQEISPELLKEWDYERNGNVKPDFVSACSHFEVYWKCDKNHSYKLAPALRVKQHQGCPYCASKRILKGYNDLESQYPHIAKEWHPTLNGSVKPDEVFARSNKAFYWLCAKCGNVWASGIDNRTVLGRGCPECGKKKRTGRPRTKSLPDKILKEFAWDKNGIIDPFSTKRRDNPVVYWRCSDCGYMWATRFYSRVNNDHGCPSCRVKIRFKE